MRFCVGLVLGIILFFNKLSTSLPVLCNTSYLPQSTYAKLKLVPGIHYNTQHFCISDRAAPPHKKISSISEKKQGSLRTDILAGTVVALAAIPTSISYSTVVGINPITGIWNSVVVGLCTTAVGGAPGLIAGSASVIALPMAKLAASAGLPYVAATAFLSSGLQIAFGSSKLSKLVGIVTEPVVCGFLNSLGLLLLRTQLRTFQSQNGVWLSQSSLVPSLLTAGICAAVVQLLPLVAKSSPVPPALAGLVVSAITAHALRWTKHIKTLADSVGQQHFVSGLAVLPKFAVLSGVPLSLGTLRIIGPTAVGLAVISIVETVLALRIAAKKIPSDASREAGDADRAVVGVGLGNVAAALIGGFGGCGQIPPTLLNVSNGGMGYESGYACAAAMALAVLFCAPLLGRLPMASLAGLMLTVAGGTMQWRSSTELLCAARGWQAGVDALAMLATTVLCYRMDVGLGIAAGVLLTQLPVLSRALRRAVSAADAPLGSA